MKINEFWEIYNKHYKKFTSPGFQVVNYPLGGDSGCFMRSIYKNDEGRYCIDITVERSNTPHHKEYDSEEAAVEDILHFCYSETGYKYQG